MVIAAFWQPNGGEREALAEELPEAVWMVDGVDPATVTAALVFFPRKELQSLGMTWADFPNLAAIQSCTAGLNHMGWHELPDVPVAAAPGATAPFIAEYVLGNVLAWSRGLLEHTTRIRKGDFRLGAPARSLASLRIGIVGYGGIGRATAALLASLGSTVEAVSRTKPEDDVLAFGGAMEDLPAMASRCDVLVVSLPLTHDTEGLISFDVLSGMTGRPALLVNVARGPVVDEGALYAWLDSSGRHWAALDVWWKYPDQGRPFDMPFETLPNVIMTPHNSPNVEGFRAAMIGKAAANLGAYAKTGTLAHVHEPSWYETSTTGDGR